jgi:adenylate cyclase
VGTSGSDRAAEYERAGLYAPGAPGAADRLAVLDWLVEDQGFTVEEIAEGAPVGTLNRLAADRAINPGPRITLDELVARSAMSPERIGEILRAAGLPVPARDAAAFSPDDVETFAVFGLGLELLGERPTLQFTRVMGAALAGIAEAAVRLFLVNKEDPLYEERAGELAHAKANLDGIRALREVPRAMDGLFLSHVEIALRRSRESRTGDRSPHTARLAVGFVDLVGFTPLSSELPVAELAALVDEFEDQAFDLVADNDGRIVKFIGDEVMFVMLTSADACDVALRLVDAFSGSDSLVTPRGGIATGDLLSRGGDYYGPVVNLASRIAELAVPYEILTTTAVRAEVDDFDARFSFDPAGRRNLKGFAEPVELYSVHSS